VFLAGQMGRLRVALAAGSVQKGEHQLKGDVRINDAPAREAQEERLIELAQSRQKEKKSVRTRVGDKVANKK